MSAQLSCDMLDPRIRRTRELLQQALENLLKTKDFDRISVQEIADTATVNRATFYDHYTDKFELLECLVARRFFELLAKRNVRFDGTCGSAMQGLVLAVCDFLAAAPETEERPMRRFEPHMESAIIAVLRRNILEGARNYAVKGGIPPEMIAAAASWAIYGAAKEWIENPNRRPAEEIVDTVAALVTPILHAGTIARNEPGLVE
ncbi:MAG TPA: TetR/AcrR family transcriptional regulator [Bryobacteraceae bacterium]|jgi:AcrR family transcriptional regulator|nr:TetR/AcrR family transcriptional regulator [Bryobacteraceae bacterium]